MTQRAIIAKILDVPDDKKQWRISSFDATNQIYVVNKLDTVKPDSPFQSLVGIIIDLNTQRVISRTPFIESVLTDSVEMFDENEYSFIDSVDVRETKFKVDKPDSSSKSQNVTFRYGLEGPVVRVFKINGKVYHSTSRQLDFSLSSWGGSRSIANLWQDLNSPVDTDLFDSDVECSPFVHSFILVHPDMMLGSHLDVKKGFLTYLGYEKFATRSVLKKAFPDKKIQDQVKVPVCTTDLKEATESQKCYKPVDLSLTDVQKHLDSGFSSSTEGRKENRLKSGEFVIMSVGSKPVCSIESRAYQWRCAMRGDDPSLYRRLCVLLENSKIGSNPQKHAEKMMAFFPAIKIHSLDFLKENLNDSFVFESLYDEKLGFFDTNHFLTPEDCFAQITHSFLAALPLNKRCLGLEYVFNYLEDRHNIVDFLIQAVKSRTVFDSSTAEGELLSKICRCVSELNGKRQVFKYVCSLNGTTLYSLFRIMNLVSETCSRPTVSDFLNFE